MKNTNHFRPFSIHPLAFAGVLAGMLGCSSYPELDRYLIDNPNNCEKNPSVCMSEIGPPAICDSQLKRCVSTGAKCASEANCASFQAAACMAGACVSCMLDKECVSWSESRRENRRFCIDAKCQQCRDNTGCDPQSATPVCDTAQNGAGTFTCRACRADSQATDCASGLCGDGGACVSPTDVVFVDNDSSRCTTTAAGGGTLEKPYCTLALGLGAGKSTIKLAGSATAYAAVTFNASGGNVEIIGPGRSASPAATLGSVSVQRGTLTLRGLSISATGVNAVECNATATVKVRDAIVSSTVAMGRAVIADPNCVRIDVERSRLSATRNALYLNDGGAGLSVTRYRIVNTAIVNTGAASAEYAVILGDGSTGYFGFNTVVRNGGGVQCNATNQRVLSSIVVQNAATDQLTSKCQRQNVILTASQVSLGTGEEPLLLDAASSATYAIDKGGTQSDINAALSALGELPVTTDYFGRPRAAGAGADIGYHELK